MLLTGLGNLIKGSSTGITLSKKDFYQYFTQIPNLNERLGKYLILIKG